MITNADALPRVINNPYTTRGEMRASVGVAAASASTSIGSTYRLVRVSSSARIHQVIVAASASGATGQFNLGLYQTAENGGAVVDADFFASAIDPGGAAIDSTDVTHESADSAANLVTRAGMRLWEALGLTSDPGCDYDVVATMSEAGASAFSIACKVVEVL